MKKTALVISLIVLALLVSARWATKAVNAPPADDVLQVPVDTSLANGLSMQDMVAQSDLIAIGSCIDTKSAWIDRTLVTLVTISVGETLKGAQLGTVTVELPGGIDANRKFPVSMSYPGAPRITPGENVFLFLTASGETAGSYNVAGFSQGKFSIVNDANGEPMVSRDLSEMSLRNENGVRRGQSEVTPLASFKQRVKGYLN